MTWDVTMLSGSLLNSGLASWEIEHLSYLEHILLDRLSSPSYLRILNHTYIRQRL